MRLPFALFLAVGCGGASSPCDQPVMVFAAASLRDVMADVVEDWDGQAQFNFAGSNVLAMQIESTEAADVFISADKAWMDRLEESGKLVPGSRRPLLSNGLVLVANGELKLAVESTEVLESPSIRHISIGDPEAVPAGRYAKKWLQSEGIWTAVSSKVAPAANVRAAMRLVEADPAVLGIVYSTDAASSEAVRVILRPDNGPDIRYPAALVQRKQVCPSASAFLDHLERADAVFERHGFGTL